MLNPMQILAFAPWQDVPRRTGLLVPIEQLERQDEALILEAALQGVEITR